MSSDACSSAFLVSQSLSFTSLPSFLQHLGGGTEFDIGQCAAASAEARRDLVLLPLVRTCVGSLDPLEACLVAGQASLDHAELNSETFVLRRLGRCATSNEESICQALAIVLAQKLLSLGKFSYTARPHKSPQSIPYSTRNMSVCSRPVEKAAHSAGRELLTTRRILRDFHLFLFKKLHGWTEFFFNQYYHNS